MIQPYLMPLALSAIFTGNIILMQFLGICPFLGVSKKSESALGMGISVIFVLLVASTFTWLVYYGILVPFKIEYMQTIVFILVISAVVQFVEMFIKKTAPALYKLLGIYLPLITTNCAVLGVAIKNIDEGYNLASMAVYSVATGIGFALVIYIFSTMREKMNNSPIPASFAGIPIALVVAALMSLTLSRFGLAF